MTQIQLRPYQERAINATIALFRMGCRSVLLVCPGGGGKTVIGLTALERMGVPKEAKAIWVADRTELISQCSERLTAMGIKHGIIKGGVPGNLMHNMQVASLQTLHRRDLSEFGEVDYVIFDEAHMSAAKSYHTIRGMFPSALQIGLTATPFRLDGKSLADVFEQHVIVASFRGLVKEGYLMPPHLLVGKQLADLSAVHKRGADYDTRELSQVMNTRFLVGDVVQSWLEHGERRPTLCFGVDIAHSVHLAQQFRDAGVRAMHVDGTTDEGSRKSALKALQDGSIEVLCNNNLFTQGTDLPIVGCIILARPTMSRALYLQMCYRASRLHPTKKDHFIILDHASNWQKHGPADQEVSVMPVKRKRKRKALSVPREAAKPIEAILYLDGQLVASGAWDRKEYALMTTEEKELFSMPQWKIKKLARESDNPKALLMRIAKLRGYKPGWVWYLLANLSEKPSSPPPVVGTQNQWRNRGNSPLKD